MTGGKARDIIARAIVTIGTRMNLGDLANLGQIIGAVAVVISLFYVAHQIQQNTRAKDR